jgi:hypothetical protein
VFLKGGSGTWSQQSLIPAIASLEYGGSLHAVEPGKEKRKLGLGTAKQPPVSQAVSELNPTTGKPGLGGV